MNPEIEQTISAYKAAFRTANNCEVGDVEYRNGWFRIRNHGAAYGTRHRRREIERFTQTLLSRKPAQQSR